MLALRDRKEAQPAAIANTGEEAEYLADPAHPRNLPTWRKVMLLVTVSMAAWLANYSAGAHLTAFPQLAEYFGVSIAAVANAIGIAVSV